MSRMDIDPVAVGARIKAARIKAGLKDYAALAKQIFQDSGKKGRRPVDPETVRLWEVGKVLPPWDKIDQLTKALKLSAQELLFAPADQPAAAVAQESVLTRARKRAKGRVVEIEEQLYLLIDSYMLLPQSERDLFLRKINVRAMEWRNYTPDWDLDSLAAPGTEAAKRHAAKTKTHTN